jgi:predicted membrane protein
MTVIVYEENGFSLEQKYRGKNFKTFIYFDSVSSKIGYYNSKNYQNVIFIIIFGIMLFFEIFNHGFRITTFFYAAIIVYFIYDFIKNLQKFKTLSLNNSKDMYFTKNEYKYIDEILDKRNKYFYEKYFKNIETYNDKDKIETINWLFKERAVNKFQILKIDGIRYNEKNDEFYMM